jgi:HSP90 family molecular chaperone
MESRIYIGSSDKTSGGTEIILHIAEDSLDFLEEYKIREYETNVQQVHADSN